MRHVHALVRVYPFPIEIGMRQKNYTHTHPSPLSSLITSHYRYDCYHNVGTHTFERETTTSEDKKHY